MAKKPGAGRPTKGDTRRRSSPKDMGGQQEAIKSDFQTQLNAEKERWQLIGGLVRKWVREALGLPGNDFGLKLYLDQMEDGFDRTAQFDPKVKIIAWEPDGYPVCVRLSRTATFVELEDGKAIFATKAKEGEEPPKTPKGSGSSNQQLGKRTKPTK
ncbi:MAG: hypothetical protein ACRC78_24815 [Planktothrix sp.]